MRLGRFKAGESVGSKVQGGRDIWVYLWIRAGDGEKVILCKAHNVSLSEEKQIYPKGV